MKTLTKVKLINWHTFSNEEFEIYKNALITGENGTGKSTILDAIQYVLTAGKCKFNKAASDIGNRTLESYIRCKTGIEGHEYARNGDVTTYIALEFYDEKTEKYQIIGTVIDLPAGGRLNRDFFQIIDCKISDVAFIEERRVLTRKEFKKALIDHQQTGIFKDTIKEGESLFGNALGVKSKYFDLVTRALAFKAIDNVYQFIVDFLLKEDFVLNGMLFKNEEGLGFEYTQYLDMDQINWYGYISWEDLLSDENNVKVLIEPRMTSRGYPLDEDGNVIGAQE